MNNTPSAPSLTPQFCFNQTVLRDFLRLSRSTIDDSIAQNLNSLLTPASQAFDPASVSSRQINLPPGRKRQISPAACAAFKQKVLFASWQVRSDVLNYCAAVATSPDPDDPDQLLREVEGARAREHVVDERLDPYSARWVPREARTESLAALVRNERMVEEIVRARTWGLVGERCDGEGQGWQAALDRWRRDQEGSRGG